MYTNTGYILALSIWDKSILNDALRELKLNGIEGNYIGVKDNGLFFEEKEDEDIIVPLVNLGEEIDEDKIKEVMNENISFSSLDIELDGGAFFKDEYRLGVRKSLRLVEYMKYLMDVLADFDIEYDNIYDPYIVIMNNILGNTDKYIEVVNRASFAKSISLYEIKNDLNEFKYENKFTVYDDFIRKYREIKNENRKIKNEKAKDNNRYIALTKSAKDVGIDNVWLSRKTYEGIKKYFPEVLTIYDLGRIDPIKLSEVDAFGKNEHLEIAELLKQFNVNIEKIETDSEK